MLMYERLAMSVRGSGPSEGSSRIYSWDLEGGSKHWMEDACVGEDMGDGEWVCGGGREGRCGGGKGEAVNPH